MAFQHMDATKFQSLDQYLSEKRELHLKHLERHMKELSNNINLSGNMEDIELDEEDEGVREKELIAKILENRSTYQDISVDLPISHDIFCPILDSVERRQKLAECAGLAEQDLDLSESAEIEEICKSRGVCGCTCKEKGIACKSDTCACFSNGIGCQQERPRFPCSCILKWCKNPHGMKRFDTKGVIGHLKEVLSLSKINGVDFRSKVLDTEEQLKTNKRKSSPRRKYKNKRKKVTSTAPTSTQKLASYGKSLRSNSKLAPTVIQEQIKRTESKQTLSPTSSQSTTSSQELSQQIAVNLISQL